MMLPPPAVPGWASTRGHVPDTADAAFMAGAALHALDQLVRSAPPWAGAWRQRLALRCAASACRLSGRSEEEAALRDAWHLRKGDEDPGPGGNVFGAFRHLATRAPEIDAAGLALVVEKLGLRWDDAFGDLSEDFDAAVRNGPAAPFAAAAIMRQVTEVAPSAEPLAWWLGDLMLAAKMRWPRSVPLLMSRAFSPAFRAENGRGKRLKPGEDGFSRALMIGASEAAADACRLAADISRRAERLQAASPKLRAKGAGEAIRRLLDDDAVPGTLATKALSRFASRRLFERLTGFDAVQELSGRSSFRLYGL